MRIKRLIDGLALPQRESEGAAGYDLRASIGGGTLTIPPGVRVLVPTGFAWKSLTCMVGMVVTIHYAGEMIEVDELTNATRGEGGFGSTGKQ